MTPGGNVCAGCGRGIAVDDHEAYLCSSGELWGAECVPTEARWACPTCGGNLALRPIQPRDLRGRYAAA